MIIAGEASGDKYGALVIEALRHHLPDCRFFGIGGDHMEAAGCETLFHVRQTSFMGFVEVARNLGTVRAMFRTCRKALAERRPSALLLIDYPGFNMRLARDARAMGIPVVYFICPQVWAWGANRVRKMASRVNHLAVVFPFEEQLFRDAGVPTTFVGHPLLDVLRPIPRQGFLATHGLADTPILGLFPGSRRQEIRRMLPVMLQAARLLRERVPCQPVIGAANVPDEVFASHGWDGSVALVRGATHALMQHAQVAIVTSGTATVETALFETPMVIAYRASRLNYEIGRRLVNVSFIGMPNILAGRGIVPELIQQDCTPERLAAEAVALMEHTAARSAMIGNLREVRTLLGTPGAAARVADIVRGVMDSTD